MPQSKSKIDVIELAKNEDIDHLIAILEKNIPVDLKAVEPDTGKTLLHYFASEKFDRSPSLSDLVRLIKKKDSSVFNVRSAKSATPLHYAIIKTCPNVVKALIPYTDMTLTFDKKQTYLHYALLPNHKNPKGYSDFHLNIVTLIMESAIQSFNENKTASCMLFEENSDGLTPLNFARSLDKKSNYGITATLKKF